MALQAGMVSKGRGQMRFSQSDAAKENHIAFFIDELESKQVFYLKLVNFFGQDLLNCPSVKLTKAINSLLGAIFLSSVAAFQSP